MVFRLKALPYNFFPSVNFAICSYLILLQKVNASDSSCNVVKRARREGSYGLVGRIGLAISLRKAEDQAALWARYDSFMAEKQYCAEFPLRRGEVNRVRVNIYIILLRNSAHL